MTDGTTIFRRAEHGTLISQEEEKGITFDLVSVCGAFYVIGCSYIDRTR